MTDDQGREMVMHKQLSQNTGIRVCFCDPHSPWQRGSNENMNALVRQ
jgi:IS30 family transposase